MNTTSHLRRWLPMWLLILFAVCTGANAAEVIPPKPTRYFNDYAQAVKPETADRLEGELRALEQQSSNQILVCIYPQMQTDSSIEDYCHRIYAGWGVGQKGKNNGAILFIFKDDRKQHIEVGRGLEGVLPDSICKDIEQDVMAPKFQAGDFDGGLTAGVEAMIQASKGEYTGTGRTVDQDQNQNGGGGGMSGGGVLLIVVAVVIFLVLGFFFPGLFNVLGLILNLFLSGSGRGGTTFGGGGSSSGGGWSSGGGDSGAGGGASGSW